MFSSQHAFPLLFWIIGKPLNLTFFSLLQVININSKELRSNNQPLEYSTSYIPPIIVVVTSFKILECTPSVLWNLATFGPTFGPSNTISLRLGSLKIPPLFEISSPLFIHQPHSLEVPHQTDIIFPIYIYIEILNSYFDIKHIFSTVISLMIFLMFAVEFLKFPSRLVYHQSLPLYVPYFAI